MYITLAFACSSAGINASYWGEEKPTSFFKNQNVSMPNFTGVNCNSGFAVKPSQTKLLWNL